MTAQNDEVSRGILAVVGGNNIDHTLAVKCRRSVKAGRVHRNQLWRGVEGHTRTVVYEVMDSVRRGLTAADVRGSAVVSVVKSVRQSEFTENAAIRCRRKRSVGARVETNPAISTKQEWISHCLIGDDVYPYRKSFGVHIVVVKLDG